MRTKKADIVGGFNAFLYEQKKITDDETRFYLVKFNRAVSIVHSGLALEKVPELSDECYFPKGSTALYDAIAQAVAIMDKDKKDDERVICVVMTDGEENCSRETTKEQIKEMIKSHEDRGDWTFVYIGENPERWAKETNMSRGNTVTYCHAQPRNNFLQAGQACSVLRRSKGSRADNLLQENLTQKSDPTLL